VLGKFIELSVSPRHVRALLERPIIGLSHRFQRSPWLVDAGRSRLILLPYSPLIKCAPHSNFLLGPLRRQAESHAQWSNSAEPAAAPLFPIFSCRRSAPLRSASAMSTRRSTTSQVDRHSGLNYLLLARPCCRPPTRIGPWTRRRVLGGTRRSPPPHPKPTVNDENLRRSPGRIAAFRKAGWSEE